jgi:hypothetical protein
MVERISEWVEEHMPASPPEYRRAPTIAVRGLGRLFFVVGFRFRGGFRLR